MSSAAQILTAAETGDSPVRHALRRLSVYLVRNQRYYLLWSITVLAYVACFVAAPLLVGRAIDAVVDPKIGADEVGRRCAMLLAVAVATGVFRFASRALVFDAAREVEYEIRNDLFSHLQLLPQSFYFHWRTGDLMSRCVNDLNSVRMLLGPGLLSAAQTPILFVAVITAMCTINVKLALMVLLPYPLFILIARGFGTRMHARSMAAQVGLADLANQVQEAVSGIAVVKAYAMEEEQTRRFEAANQSVLERNLALVVISALMPAITGLLPGIAMAIVIFVGFAEFQAGRINISGFFTFAMYVFALTFPTFILGWVFGLLQRGAASMQRIDEILSVEPAIRDHDAVVDVAELSGEIEFRGLTFNYHEKSESEARVPALRDVSLHVPAGSSLGIVGPVGSGKTTLASVIPRLYEVEDGQVLLDGIDINRLPLETLRRSIAMVPQDAFLFSMSLADNVAYGLPPDASPAQVREAADRAQLTKDVLDLPQGFDTLVGERGVMLSGGQRQRTALARALALRPSILILDDTLSAVDAETEDAIQRGLSEVFEGRTVVVVASRVSTVRECDQIVVLDAGRIVEAGDHDTLLARGGLYARLASEQAEAERRLQLEQAVSMGAVE
jgi:ATP-binding cassette subfamily B protein